VLDRESRRTMKINRRWLADHVVEITAAVALAVGLGFPPQQSPLRLVNVPEPAGRIRRNSFCCRTVDPWAEPDRSTWSAPAMDTGLRSHRGLLAQTLVDVMRLLYARSSKLAYSANSQRYEEFVRVTRMHLASSRAITAVPRWAP